MQQSKCVRAIKVLDLILLHGRFICWFVQHIEKLVYQRLPSKGQCKSEAKVKLTKIAMEEVAEHFCHPSVHRLSAGTNNSPYLGAFSCAPLLPLFLHPLQQITGEGEIRVFPIIRRNQRGYKVSLSFRLV